MGTFAASAGFSNDIFGLASAFLGHRRGGLAYASVGGAALFGCVCGSSLATAATFAKISLPEMLRRNYDPSFAAARRRCGRRDQKPDPAGIDHDPLLRDHEHVHPRSICGRNHPRVAGGRTQYRDNRYLLPAVS